MNERDKLARERMARSPYAPIATSTTDEHRKAHALEYIAYYLSEIEKHLSKIAIGIELGNTNGVKISQSLGSIAQELPAPKK